MDATTLKFLWPVALVRFEFVERAILNATDAISEAKMAEREAADPDNEALKRANRASREWMQASRALKGVGVK